MIDKSNKTNLSAAFGYAKEWQDIWMNVLETNRALVRESVEAMLPHLRQTEEHPVTIFDPQIVIKTLNKAVAELSKKPQSIKELQTEHFKGVLKLMETVTQHLQGQEVKPLIDVETRDKRFKNPIWKDHPAFFFMQQLYLLNARLLKEVLSQMEELDPQTSQKLAFYTKHLIDAMSPTNFPLTNPDVIRQTFETKGENLIQGFKNFLSDSVNGQLNIKMTDMEALKLGVDIATSPGKVVFRNELLELIQYSPTTAKVHSVPILIIPPWINKFYVFDLKPENSFIRWAVDKGYTLFIISWVNPDKRHSGKTLTDYTLQGAKEAFDFVRQYTNHKSINMIGYCTGGVLLNCLMTYLKAKGKDKEIKSATLIAAPTDFREAGDLLVYVCEAQLKKLESHIKKKGYLDAGSMMQSFNLLRANDLIWSFYINNYLMGKEPIPFDMLHWNSDAVRMPGKMHSDFLRKMYLENRLIQPGGIKIGDVPIDLTTITTPMFIMAAADDHIAPWRAVFPLSTMVKGATEFVLSSSGHVAGVFNHPEKHKYNYWKNGQKAETADEWLASAEKVSGSWWPVWQEWMEKFSGKMVEAHPISDKNSLGEAPGTYVVAK
ncbi:PHA/PHB synthase family protein [Candidatus Paracaedibacter symbiosus]|uniref:PHA/PHB synthase family protein n=1 Tax=Candidatus Paracaedibacter symbiosus TaxID=244582 RepID=UPI00068D3288|nr:class I poly(R)-hydroxyalkanoic acid synthase [Candidatus Paracaedibacter symbiosus]